MADIATMGTNKLRNALKSARGSLGRIRDAAEEAAIRGTIVMANVAGGGLTGFVIGRAERDGKDITIGDSDVRWTLPFNGVLAFGGAFLPRAFLGTQIATSLGHSNSPPTSRPMTMP